MSDVSHLPAAQVTGDAVLSEYVEAMLGGAFSIDVQPAKFPSASGADGTSGWSEGAAGAVVRPAHGVAEAAFVVQLRCTRCNVFWPDTLTCIAAALGFIS